MKKRVKFAVLVTTIIIVAMLIIKIALSPTFPLSKNGKKINYYKKLTDNNLPSPNGLGIL